MTHPGMAPDTRCSWPPRLWRVVSLLLLLSVTLTSCGSDGNTGAAQQPATGTGGATFPVTIEHKYGRTEIEEAPERVVSVGFNDHDPILALGVKPVAVREWFGERPFATWPWAQDKLGDATPEVLGSGELNFEKIAALQPDLIVGVYSGITEKEYETLSEIAPTVAQPDDFVDFGTPWQEQTRIIGRALGREQRAEELVAEVEDRFAQAREEHPEFEGATGLVAYSFEPGSYGVYGPQDLRARFLTSLGFEVPNEIAELTGDEFFANISAERLRLLDSDVLVWIVYSETGAEQQIGQRIKDNPLYRQLDVARQGRDVFPDETLYAAISFGTVLSLPFLLDGLVPLLEAAVDGDPHTKASSP